MPECTIIVTRSCFIAAFRPTSSELLMQRLRGLYQAIVLEYFQSPETANARIDELVALAFFADIGAAQLLELHMNLMEDFAKQLKLEGRSEEILLDYRLTLIDVMAHLSEMYRRSIPKTAPRILRYVHSQSLCSQALRGGQHPNSLRALSTLQDILEKEFRGVYTLKVIDVLKNPATGRGR
jgi:hypothetical protein